MRSAVGGSLTSYDFVTCKLMTSATAGAKGGADIALPTDGTNRPLVADLFSHSLSSVARIPLVRGEVDHSRMRIDLLDILPGQRRCMDRRSRLRHAADSRTRALDHVNFQDLREPQAEGTIAGFAEMIEMSSFPMG